MLARIDLLFRCLGYLASRRSPPGVSLTAYISSSRS
jgi:hypothetical protein